jgi:fucose permease
MAIIGGALLPVLFASIADARGIATAYVVPMLAYLGIALFAFLVGKGAVSSS